MKPALFEALRARACGCKVANNLLARCVYNIVCSFSPSNSQAMHDLVYTVENEACRYKLTAKQKNLILLAADCIRFGWTQHIAGKVVSKITLPEGLERRWRIVCVEALQKGVAIAQNQLLAAQRSSK